MASFTIKEGPHEIGKHKSDDNGTRKWGYTVRYEVRADSQNFRAHDVDAFLGITIGDAYAFDSKALCRSGNVDKTDNHATATYVYETGITSDPGNPLSEPPHYNWYYEETNEIVDIAYDMETSLWTKPVLNTSGCPYEPGISRTVYYPVLRVSKKERTVDYGTIYAYMNATNSDTFKGAEPGTLRVKIQADEQFDAEEGIIYQVNYEFVYRPDPKQWRPYKTFSRGFQELDDDGNLHPIMDENGNPATEPVLLTEDGKKADPNSDDDDDKPYIQEFILLDELPFGSLGI